MNAAPAVELGEAITHEILDFSVNGERAGDVTLPTLAPIREDLPPTGKHSCFILSLLLFLGINLVLSFTNPIEFDPYRYLYKGWDFWALKDLRQDQDAHNIALLGSSLIVSAVSSCDANYLHRSLDMTTYHKATYLDDLLRTRFGGDYSSFNLSAPGQMPSDAYLTLKAMVEIAQRPDVVIYGIAPRDFIDSTLSSPADTEHFKYLQRIVNVDDVASGLYRTPFPRLEWFLQRSIYMCGSSLDLQMLVNDYATIVMGYLVPKPTWTARPFTWWDRKKLLPTYLFGEIIPNSMLVAPATVIEAKANYRANMIEYKERYKRPVPSIYQTQFYFLRKLAAYCRREKIELVLVNMPLTQDNVSLLKPMVYLQYLQAIKIFGFSQNLAVLDLCDWTKYRQQDFHDSVHLNGYGGKKFFMALVDECAKITRVRQTLTLAGIQLHARESLAESERIRAD